jgi:signal transduction histidine kinase/ligand-binding sensor domain-containing protein/DNA-binding response OmpR family regulator
MLVNHPSSSVPARPERAGDALARSHLPLLLFITAGLLGGLLPGRADAQGVPNLRLIPQPDGPLVERKWTARTGLPVNQITGMVRGSDGYLWLTTFDGLVRFDGVRFTLFNKGQTPELPSARFSSLLGEWGGALWLMTEADHLITFQNAGFRDHSPDLAGRVHAVARDDHDGVWVGTAEGLFRLEADRFVRVPLEQEGAVTTILIDEPRNRLVLARSQGAIHALDLATSRLDVLLAPIPNTGALGRLVIDERGVVWGAAHWGALRTGDGVVRTFPVEGAWGWPLALHPPRSEGDELVLVMVAGTFRWEEGSGWRRLTIDDSARLGLPSVRGGDGGLWTTLDDRLFRNGDDVLQAESKIRFALVDPEGSVWGAGPSGLYQFQRASVEGYPLQSPAGFHEAYALHEGPSGVWVVSTGPAVSSGLWRLDERGGTLVAGTPSPDLPSRLEMSVLEDRQGQLWVALDEGGVCRLVAMRCDPAGRFPMEGETVRAIFEARDGTLWFGTTRSLRALRPDGSWRTLAEADGLPAVTIRAIAETPEGHLWLGTQRGGVIYWDGQAFRAITMAEGLPTNAVRGLYLDAQGVLWVGTEGVGVARVTPGTPGPDGAPRWTIAAIRQADGLFDDGVHQILEDPAGRLWMSSNRGLFYVPRREAEAFLDGQTDRVHAISFDERDGLLNRELNGGTHGAGIRTRDGRLIFPGMRGLAIVDPGALEWNRPPPMARIEGLVVGGRALAPEQGMLRLPREADRNLEIEFTALSFWAPQTIRFRYRLRGVDATWRESIGLRTAFYTNLRGGRYTFEVEASTQPGVWSEAPDQMVIVVPYRAYEHPAAQAGFGFLLLLGLAGMVSMRERRLRSQARNLEILVAERTRVVESQAERLVQMDRMKSRLFEDISHELRTPLTLIVAPLEGVRDRLKVAPDAAIRREVELALQSSRRLLDLVAQILDLARLEAGRLPVRVRPLDTAAWIRHQILAFSPLAQQKGVKLRLELPDELPDLWSSADLFQKMLGNLVSNAIKFTPELGVARIRGWASDEHFFVEVRDSGPGIPADRIHTLFQRFSEAWDGSTSRGGLPSTRIGLSLAHQLAELHGGGIEVSSEEGFGATFVLKLRLGWNHFPESVEIAEAEPSLSAPLVAARSLPLMDGGAEGDAPSQPDSDAPEGAPVGSVPPGPAAGVPVATESETPAPSKAGAATEAEGMAGVSAEQRGKGAADLSVPIPADAPDVLVVEDDPGVRAYLHTLLGTLYHVRTAADGHEALGAVAERPPSLIVSDLRMPQMDGLELLAAIREQDRARTDGLTTPFLLVSAHDDTVGRTTAYRLGASDFMTKPFSPRHLLARIDGLLTTQTLLEARRPVLRVSASQVEVESTSASLLTRLAQLVEQNLSDPDFGAEELARALGYSRSGLYRKLEDIGEAAPAQILQRMRLDRAAQLLADEAGSVSRIATQCGFRSMPHFSRVFKERFGVPPSRYTKESVAQS